MFAKKFPVELPMKSIVKLPMRKVSLEITDKNGNPSSPLLARRRTSVGKDVTIFIPIVTKIE